MIILNQEDIIKMREVEDYELVTDKQIKEEQDCLNQCIEDWLEISNLNPKEINIGKYYGIYLLSRDFLQTYIVSTSKETSLKIEKLIQPGDDFFKQKMLPKKHQFPNLSLSDWNNCFWYTHSIHPIDLSFGIEKEKSHPKALQILQEDDFFWETNSADCPFGDKFGRMSLWEFRAWRIFYSQESILKCLDWILDCFKVKKEEYEENILNSKDFSQYRKTEIILDKTIISTVFGQFADEGKIDVEAIPMAKVAIQKQLLYTEISSKKLMNKILSILMGNFKQKSRYTQNLNKLLTILNQM